MRRQERPPQLSAARCAADGGLETSLLAAGQELPLFAAFVLLEHEEGRQALRQYYAPYLALARARGVQLILDTPTWRASSAWGDRLGWSADRLAAANRAGVELLEELRDPGLPFAISGCIGPRTDSEPGDPTMDATEAEAYHGAQVATFAATSADLVTALTLTSAAEAIGIVRAAVTAGISVVVSLQVGLDGHLAGGQTLGDAVVQIDAETASGAASFMLNCAHPTHVAAALEPAGPWIQRISGFRANAAAGDDEPGDSPLALAASCRALAARLPAVTVLGGCCGTDHRHVDALLEAWG
jgi:homocysteine S-methyltransferase